MRNMIPVKNKNKNKNKTIHKESIISYIGRVLKTKSLVLKNWDQLI